MDSAGKVIRSLKMPGGCLSNEELIRAAWPRVVGKRIAEHTRAVSFNGTRLVVEVGDAVWQSQLRTLEKQILKKIWLTAGDDSLSGIEFRVGVPRRAPQRAEVARPADEADGIQDFALRRIYKSARQKALFA